ncbi:monofunctional biosynthetic peptidoglycan transglycosylase [Marinobacterium nitratireducens]|uniref:Biosynthetic peptidoglycan transglycosylase n=1 Tax=Marinobacterium nitratireducens TaxID=518897 RepID=A0A918DMT8_9GAMM|nr:monofunctional biosynthetic peptidoglycan transglycosylase [Marinobacterium nitratireducens]GGO75663.1 monofunctional biosynthetic peptidoglycan transglycosylase [Marinobacterium nitratireducens]
MPLLKRYLFRPVGKALLWLAGGWILFSLLLVLLLRFVDPPIWSWLIQRELFPPQGYPESFVHDWVARERISPSMQLAVIAAEDQRFPEHSGFDFKAIKRALEHNLDGGRVRGASTLTQQTAKNLFLWSGRSWVRKGLEAWFALLLELCWDKGRILEVYLNIVEFGPGIYGVEAAARHFYGVPAANLSAWQSARLAAVLPNPYRYRAQPPSSYVVRRGRWIGQQMRQLGSVTLKAVDG